ncbi:MAG: 2-isopropylmalate synthase [Acidimicrobiales bacterium]|nr:2-isopropylmalate synthase [Acidimicrobiales bacterium]MED5446261.1 2-isopropylmalate synthase [Actinomycetota bacterium]|tara:strand:- start:5867 stop:7567 length:1701 start_codon:yes stop_codon:yes gene_type:complete
MNRNPSEIQNKSNMPFKKYRAYETIDLPDRSWPSAVIADAPLWCSVDLRDGNQALIEPMDPDRKWRMFKKLVEIGFKEIEVGFPSASEADFTFVREIIEEKAIPDDVTIQVLVQSRPELIDRTFESIAGAKNAIIHFYNSTSTLQRKVVFGLDREGIKKIAVDAARYCKSLESTVPDTNIRYEYSPESFTGTELDFAKEICDAVVDAIDPSPSNKIIINLPATVEMASANTYGDMIEWMHCNLNRRDDIILSLHPHNDRGTGVAAAEFGLMAGADRVEGTLFGNGERTGNVDVINIAMNMYSQGVDPMLDISDINDIRRVAEYCNQLPVHPRHPYVGDLVYTAFSGSHQDAIKKGFDALKHSDEGVFEVPYIPIDPFDVGRTYEDVVRVNSQSGKGGVSYLLKTENQFDLPRRMQIEFTRSIQRITDATGKEITAQQIFNEFSAQYLDLDYPFLLHGYESAQNAEGRDRTLLTARMTNSGEQMIVQGEGSGSLDAFVQGLRIALPYDLRVLDYHEHSKGTGVDATAVAYVEMAIDGKELWGCGLHTDITRASMRAIISAINRANKD